MVIPTIIFLFFLLSTYALFLAMSRKHDALQERLERRVAEALQETFDTSEGAVQITQKDSIGGNEAIHRILSSLNFVTSLDQMIKQADVNITVSRLLMFSGVAGLMAGFAAATM